MDASQIARLFEAFSQADSSMTRRFGGTGLGLAISRHLVELMGGQLEVSSEPGQGSRFSFTLRLGRAEPAPALPPETPSGLHVLVVDADPRSRHILQQLLTELSHTSEGTDAPAAALDILRRAIRAAPSTCCWPPAQTSTQPPARPATPRSAPAHRPDRLRRRGRTPRRRRPAPASHHRPRLREAIAAALTPGDTAAPRRRSPAAGPAPLAGLRILLVEDNDINQLIARGLLEQLGATVTWPTTGVSPSTPSTPPGPTPSTSS
jgi:CheY-like chemotaxis protein